MSSVIKAEYVVHADVDNVDSQARSLPKLADERDISCDGDVPGSVTALARALLDRAPLQRWATRAAQLMLESARHDADDIVKSAETRRADVVADARREGYDAGYDAGYEAGRNEGRNSLQRLHGLLDDAVRELHHVRQNFLDQTRQDVVELAVALAAKLIRRTGGFDANTAKSLLAEMLPRTAGTRQVIVKLHAQDLAALQDELPEMSALADPDASVQFVADARLEPGDVLVETERGMLDGTGAARARRLVKHLLDVMEHEG